MAQANETLAKSLTIEEFKTRWIKDVATNDSNKSLTVPAGRKWQILSIRIEFTATATVGNRILEVRYCDEDNSDTIFASELAAAITASQAMVLNLFPGATVVAPTDGDNQGTQPIPEGIFLGESDYVQIIDSAAVDAAADDMVVHMLVREYRR